MRRSRRLSASGRNTRLRGESLAALGTAVGQDGTSSTRAHPSPEAVLACPATIVGLEGALHLGAPGGMPMVYCELDRSGTSRAVKGKGSTESRSNRGTGGR
jgi:hypothetical protein